MGRRTAVVGFSISPELAREYEKLAARQKTTKSELFRRIVENYKAQIKEEEFFELQRKMARRARKRGAFTEEDIERMVFEHR